MRALVIGIMVMLGVSGCAKLPENMPTAFAAYSAAAHERVETLNRTAVGLNVERRKAHEIAVQLQTAWASMDHAKTLEEAENQPLVDKIQGLLAALTQVSKPDVDVSNTLSRVETDLLRLDTTAELIAAILTEVVERQSGAASVLDVAVGIITESAAEAEGSADTK